MKKLVLLFLVCLSGFGDVAMAQTNSTTSGNWNDINVWSTGVVPVNTTNVNVNHPITINQNIAITTGDYTVNSNATDLPGGTAFNLSVGALGIFDVYGYVVFEGTGSTAGGGPNDATLIVRNGATLVLGTTSINNKSIVLVEAGGTLIINGNLTIDDNQGSFTIQGLLQVNGNLSIPQGNIQIDGGGDVFTSGTVFSTGSSEIFGSTGDCDTGPCSGRNLCSTFDNVIGANQTLCSGSTPALLTNLDNDGVSGGAVYSWEQSIASSSSGFTTISGATTSTYQPSALAVTTWFRRVILDAACTGTSAPVKMTVIPSGGWKGITSDWHIASNWCSNSVPTATTDVEITTGVPFQPIIGAAAVCRNLSIVAGATVTISASNSLDIKGNLTNNGTLTVNTSTVSFTGTSTQIISGTSLNIFNNLVINNTSGLTPALRIGGINNVGVNNALTLTAGLVDLNGYNLTIGSSAASPGSIAYTGGRFYNGNLMRWFNPTAKAIGTIGGLFPIGTATDYRPFFVGHTVLTTGGTIRVSHTGIVGSTDVAFADDLPVQKRSNSFWSIATANGLNVGGSPFSLRVEGTNFGTIQEVIDLRITQVSTVSGSPGANGGTTSNPQVNRIAVPLTGINNDVFHISSVDGTNSPLPVELISFNASLENGVVKLSWVTSSEINNDFFTVERISEGDEKFNALSTIKGAGTKTTESSYEWIDKNPLVGISYYRLKQTDFDGRFTYSDVRVIENTSTSSRFSIYPNPIADNKFTLEMNQLPSNAEVPVSVVNMQGAIIHQATYRSDTGGNLKTTVEMNSVPSGVYMVVINAATGLRKKIVIP
jgi:Secretion system C-terminal sorting domain